MSRLNEIRARWSVRVASNQLHEDMAYMGNLVERLGDALEGFRVGRHTQACAESDASPCELRKLIVESGRLNAWTKEAAK